MAPDPDYEIEEEDKPLPEFHGEPVPDSDDEIVIEGVSRRKSNATKKNSVQEEEPIPGDEHMELDFCRFNPFALISHFPFLIA